MTTLFSLIAIICMIFAVGAIDGPTLETSGDNFVLCFVLATVGIMSMFLAIKCNDRSFMLKWFLC